MPSSACDWRSDVCSSDRSEEHTSELQSRSDLVCRLLLEKKKKQSKLSAISDGRSNHYLKATQLPYHLVLPPTVPLRNEHLATLRGVAIRVARPHDISMMA